MRIVQIIDSLDVGGAEKMAVNYANALSENISFSGLVATRKEGNLKKQLSSKVNYLFLKRKNKFDLASIFRLRTYCKKNNVDFLQPHSSSFFTALLLKLVYPKVKIIWHDHNGLSEFLSARKSIALKIASYFFKGIIVVNYQLKNWAERELNCNKVIYLPNFTTANNSEVAETKLNGIQGKRVLSLANLRHQKNHFLLVDVAEKLKLSHPEWTFHLVGKNFNDEYSEKLIELIEEKNLDQNIFLYGSKDDSINIIKQSEIAILTSKSEGLPVALLEYGLLKKPVVVTNVGELPFIIKNGENGFIVDKNDAQGFYESLHKLIENDVLRTRFGENLFRFIDENNSEYAVINKYLSWLRTP